MFLYKDILLLVKKWCIAQDSKGVARKAKGAKAKASKPAPKGRKKTQDEDEDEDEREDEAPKDKKAAPVVRSVD